MNGKPRVSILSPVFNEEIHIRGMIESVLMQTISDFELVIVDDGSTDRTVEMVREIAARDRRVILVPPCGKLGKVGAFNAAYRMSNGENIVFLGGDDTLPPKSLELRLDAINGGRAAAFFALRTMSDSLKHDGHVIPKRGRSNFSGGTCILTRELASHIFPLPETLVAEDIWLRENVKLLANEIVQLPDIVLNYRIHGGNSNPRNKPFEEMREQMYARARPYGLLLKSPPRELRTREYNTLTMRKQLADAQYSGSLWRVLTVPRASWRDKARAASMASSFLFRVRSQFFGLFSGH